MSPITVSTIPPNHLTSHLKDCYNPCQFLVRSRIPFRLISLLFFLPLLSKLPYSLWWINYQNKHIFLTLEPQYTTLKVVEVFIYDIIRLYVVHSIFYQSMTHSSLVIFGRNCLKCKALPCQWVAPIIHKPTAKQRF